MTFEEARALFPVLARVAYLNAGTFGPLARPVVDQRPQRLDQVVGQAKRIRAIRVEQPQCRQ